jgi:DNA polymerase-1
MIYIAFVDETEPHTAAVRENKQKRHQAKNGVNFPIVYGAFAKRIGEDNGVSTEEAQRWLDEFDALYPGVKKAIARTRKEVASKGYVRTLMGRKRRFPYYHSAQRYEKGKMERQAFNVKIQGFSADTMKIASVMMIPVYEEYGAIPIKVVHDELVYECPEEKAKAFAAKLKEVQEYCVCISVPLPVEVDIVNSYGE